MSVVSEKNFVIQLNSKREAKICKSKIISQVDRHIYYSVLSANVQPKIGKFRLLLSRSCFRPSEQRKVWNPTRSRGTSVYFPAILRPRSRRSGKNPPTHLPALRRKKNNNCILHGVCKHLCGHLRFQTLIIRPLKDTSVNPARLLFPLKRTEYLITLIYRTLLSKASHYPAVTDSLG